MVKPAQFSVWAVNLNPVKGSEQSGFRPVVVLSPDEMNKNLNTVIVAPLTTTIRQWPSRIDVVHAGKEGSIALDQLRSIDKKRLQKDLGFIADGCRSEILEKLAEIFS